MHHRRGGPARPTFALSTLLLALSQCGLVSAQSLSETVVSASRSEQRLMDTAASINRLDRAQIQEGQAQANLSESLVRVPGFFALNRQNYAQDLLLSSRGFGANSAFGARGIRLFVDGVPGTVADGQGQVSHIDLASTDHIEVMRGPFSALYGNAAGGVVRVFTEDGQPGTQFSPYYETGSFGLRKQGLKVSGEQGAVNYVLDAGSFQTQGFRQNSAATRSNSNAKLKLALDNGAQLQLVLNRLSLSAQDPLGLTAAQLSQNRSQAGNFAQAYGTRKAVDQTQGGLVLHQQVDADDRLEVTSYYGQRSTAQYQAGTALSGLTPAVNGVIDLDRTFYGLDAHWLRNDRLQGMPLNWVLGVDSNRNDDHRQTFNNQAGTALAASASNQNLSQFASNLDSYAQAELRASERTSLSAGLRHSDTTLGSVSNNSLPGSGNSRYSATTGLLALQHYVSDDSNVYVSYGTGFDTPTLNQVAYSPASLQNTAVANVGNFGLQAARTRQLELGMKSQWAEGVQWQAALFSAVTSNDLVIAASNGGKTAYMNAPQTSRKGLEFNAHLELPHQFQFNAALTLLRAQVDTAYTSYAGAVPVAILAGNRIPGVPGRSLYTELLWQRADRGLEAAVEGRLVGNLAANDVNGAFAAGYGLLNARVVARQQVGGWEFSEFLRVDNLTDRSYVGSVIVNQAASQFYEPSPGRNWVLGAKGVWRF
ncbi:MAG: TonB-dependent receptor [Curvibacter sp.]|nr:TonB-dependent receptor [Curvibacter sp.]